MTAASGSKGRKRRSTVALRAARINLRATATQEKLIRGGASAAGKTVSQFILDSACRAAQDMRLDQTQFWLTPAAWKKLVAALDRPAKPKPGLVRLLGEPAPWEK